jgi:hypothetical protein
MVVITISLETAQLRVQCLAPANPPYSLPHRIEYAADDERDAGGACLCTISAVARPLLAVYGAV